MKQDIRREMIYVVCFITISVCFYSCDVKTSKGAIRYYNKFYCENKETIDVLIHMIDTFNYSIYSVNISPMLRMETVSYDYYKISDHSMTFDDYDIYIEDESFNEQLFLLLQNLRFINVRIMPRQEIHLELTKRNWKLENYKLVYTGKSYDVPKKYSLYEYLSDKTKRPATTKWVMRLDKNMFLLSQ